MDQVNVKGKQEPVRIFEPQPAAGSILHGRSSEDVQAFERALAHYRRQQWTEAETVLHTLSQARPDQRLYAIFLQRVQQYRQTPPPADWNGVYEFHTK